MRGSPMSCARSPSNCIQFFQPGAVSQRGSSPTSTRTMVRAVAGLLGAYPSPPPPLPPLPPSPPLPSALDAPPAAAVAVLEEDEEEEPPPPPESTLVVLPPALVTVQLLPVAMVIRLFEAEENEEEA